MNPVRLSWTFSCLMITALWFAFPGGVAATPPVETIEIKMTSPSQGARRSPTTGARIEIISMTQRVSHADLDLTTHAGMERLLARIEETARSLCALLDHRSPLPSATERRSCVRQARADAMAQVRSVITALESRPRPDTLASQH